MKTQDGSPGHRGFGFVTFKDQAATDSVLAQAGQLNLDGRQIDVKMALPPDFNPPEGAEPNKLFVGSLPKENFNTEALKSYFSQWGVLTDSWVSEGRGFGFVTYEDCNGAYKALLHGLNSGHSVVEGMQLDVKWATPKPSKGGGGRGNNWGAQGRGGYGRGEAYGGNPGGFQQSSGGYAAAGNTYGGGYQGSGGGRYQPY